MILAVSDMAHVAARYAGRWQPVKARVYAFDRGSLIRARPSVATSSSLLAPLREPCSPSAVPVGSPPKSAANVVDMLLPLALLAAGALHPERSALWFACAGVAWAALLTVVLGGAALVHALSLRAPTEARIQGVRTRPALIAAEAFESTRAMFIAATLAAWPLTQWQLGRATGMVHGLDALAARGFTPVSMTLVTLGGVVVMDAWLYWKHRLLHTRWLFSFHKAHHAFRDPTAFAAFAVAPVESLLTFWPILLLCWTEAVHWLPLYATLVLGFMLLNFYLHCGVTVRWVERILPRALFNTSAFHNLHHARAMTHFGEALTVWDHVCGTTALPLGRSESGESGALTPPGPPAKLST